MGDLSLTFFELGTATAMMAWGLVQWRLIQKRVYAFIAITLGFFAAKLLTHHGLMGDALALSATQNQALRVLFGIGFGINSLYMVYLLLVDADTVQKRRRLFQFGYVICFWLGLTSLFVQGSATQTFSVLVLSVLMAILSRDFGLSAEQNTLGRAVHTLQWGIYGLFSVSFVVHAAHLLLPSVVVFNEPLVHVVFAVTWITTGVLIMALLSLRDRHSYAQRCADASDAMQRADDENKRRLNQQRFLSMLVHEIRTPLSVLKIGTDTLIQTSPDPKGIWADRINVAIDNITQVIENCVQAEKHEEGLVQPQHTTFMVELELADIASEVATAQPELASRIQLAMDSQGRHWLHTDKHYLRSIMLNLLGNALKYSPPFTPIHLRVYKTREKNQPMMRFEIENDIGKAGAPDPRMVFQRYYRAEAAKKFAGTGLGLWLSQTMARQIGTQLQMKLHANQTVLFAFSLPIVQRP